MKWYIIGIKKYAKFSGRSSYREFWYFFLFNAVFSVTAILLDNAAVYLLGDGAFCFSYKNAGWITWAYGLFSCIPGLSMSVRRLHDLGKSGFWLLLNLIPYLGTLIFLFIMTGKAQPGENRYGKRPA